MISPQHSDGDVVPHGVIAPIASPVAADGSVQQAVLRAMIRGLLPDVDGVFVLGTSGEMPALRDETALETARLTIDEVNGRVPVYLGVGDVSLDRTLARLRVFGALGADAFVVTAPYYFPSAGDALVGYFRAVADAAPLPILLYNVPQSTHNVLTAPVVAMLAAHPNIVGIKDSTGDPFLFGKLLRLRHEKFRVLQGREQLLGPAISAGADGSVSSLSNIAPRLVQALSRAAANPRRSEEAHRLQQEVTQLAELFDEGFWLCALKAALQELGWAVGDPRPPLVAADESQRAAIRRVLATTDPRWLNVNSPAAGESITERVAPPPLSDGPD